MNLATSEAWVLNPIRAQVDAFPSMVPICQLLWPTHERSEAETMSNGHLIATAPALRAALLSLRQVVPHFWHDDSPHIDQLDRACRNADEVIAQSRGVAP